MLSSKSIKLGIMLLYASWRGYSSDKPVRGAADDGVYLPRLRNNHVISPGLYNKGAMVPSPQGWHERIVPWWAGESCMTEGRVRSWRTGLHDGGRRIRGWIWELCMNGEA